ncbi:MAG TPA: AsmA family protein [Methylomirabilota bacterium]|nr:AsmA family protein [Methylomirabilota bacterium]
MLKWLAIAVGALLVLLVAAALALPLLLDTPAIQAYATQAATHALNRPVKFTSLSISTLPLPSVKLRGLQVAEDPAFGTAPFLTVAEGRIGIRLWPLFSGRIEMADLTLEEPRIALVEDAAGRWNVGTLAASTTPGPPPPRRDSGRSGGASAGAVLLSHVSIKDGVLDYHKRGAKGSDFRLEKINVTLTQAGFGETLRLNGTALGQPGALSLKISDATLTPGGVRTTFGDTPFKAKVEIEAKDVAPFSAAVLTTPALFGPMKGRLELTGTPARLAGTGNLSFDRLTVSEEWPRCQAPKRRQLAVDTLRLPISLTPAQLDSAPLDAKLAQGTVSTRLALTLGQAPMATLKDINIKGLQLGPLLVDFLCQSFAVTGPLDLTGEATARVADALHTANGSGRLRIGRGKVVGSDVVQLMDAVLGMADQVTAALRSGRLPKRGESRVEFDSITATYTITNGVWKTDDLLYQAGTTRIAAKGTYGLPDGRVAMDVTFTEGANQIKGRVTGVAGSLRVVPTELKIPETKSLKKLLDQLLR